MHPRIPLVIINFDQLTLTKQLIDEIVRKQLNVEIHIIDNMSTYEPLLDYYGQMVRLAPGLLSIHRLDRNYGHTAMWSCPGIKDHILGSHTHYILTDPDLDIRNVPRDVIEVSFEEMGKHSASVVGLSLDITRYKPEMGIFDYQKEKAWWSTRLNERCFQALVDTTWGLRTRDAYNFSGTHIRLDSPYTAIHVPWDYAAGLAAVPPDYIRYMKNANRDVATFARMNAQKFGIE